MKTGCIKTGCNVYFPDYSQTLSVDVYRVGNCLVIKAHQDQVGGGDGLDNTRDPELVVRPEREGEEFWRTDLGLLVVPEEICTWTNLNHP